jgi:hypothetical protein
VKFFKNLNDTDSFSTKEVDPGNTVETVESPSETGKTFCG